jgi:hypothetical protein
MNTKELVERLRVKARHDDGQIEFVSSRQLDRNIYAEAADALERLERERDEAKAIVAKCCNALPNGAYCPPDASIDFMGHVPDEVLLVTSRLVARASDAEAKLAKAERALEEAKKVIKPFAVKSKQFDDACDAMRHPRPDDGYRPKTEFTHGHLRAARKWMESRHD